MIEFNDFTISSDNPLQYATLAKVGHTYAVLLPAVEWLDCGTAVEMYAPYAEFTDINDALDLVCDLNDEIDELSIGFDPEDFSMYNFGDYDFFDQEI
jgi:hypothetical protein